MRISAELEARMKEIRSAATVYLGETFSSQHVEEKSFHVTPNSAVLTFSISYPAKQTWAHFGLTAHPVGKPRRKKWTADITLQTIGHAEINEFDTFDFFLTEKKNAVRKKFLAFLRARMYTERQMAA